MIRVAAHVNHWGLYALLVLMPITGFLATNAWGFPLSIFGVLPMPVPVGKDEEIAKVLLEKESLDGEEIYAIIKRVTGHEVAKRPPVKPEPPKPTATAPVTQKDEGAAPAGGLVPVPA